MILDTADIELLRLLGWCKNLPSDSYKRFGMQALHPRVVGQMEALGLVGVADNRACIRLRPNGWRLLRYLGFDFHEDAGYRTDYGRRLEVANILLTFYRAGYDVFAQRLEDLSAPQVFLQAPVARRNSAAGDLWGGAGFHGMTGIQEYVSACYYVSGHEGQQLHRRNERLLLDKAASMLRRGHALVFAGSDYSGIASLLRKKPQGVKEGATGKKTYAEMFREAACPVCLLECSDAGALQLLVMAQKDYRKRLGRAIFHIEPVPPPDVRDADGEVVLTGQQHPSPWVMAVDMDLKRVDRAVKQAADAGYPMLVILCLEQQLTAIERVYIKNDRVMTVGLGCEYLDAAFGALSLYEPKRGAYYDPEGGVLDATDLPIHRANRKQV